MDFDIQQKIQPELNSGERLIWAGKPQTGIRFQPSDIFLTIFALFWLAITIPAFIFGKDNESDMGILFHLPFILIGLYFLLGRFMVDAIIRRGTFYGLTDQRVIIVSGIFQKKTKSLNIRTLTDITVSEKKNGGGTISFGPMASGASMFKGTYMPGMSVFAPPMFDMIEDARSVYQQILDAQKNAA